MKKEQPVVKKIEHISFTHPLIFDVTPDVKLLWMKEVANDTVRLELFFDAGLIRGGQSIPKIVKSLLLSGTDTQTSLEIQEGIDACGGYVDIDLGSETAIISIYCLREHILTVAQQVFNAIQHLSFRENEVTDILNTLSHEFKVNKQKVKSVVSEAFRLESFPNNPVYGWKTELSDFEESRPAAYKTFWKEHYLNGLTRMALVGNLDQDTVDALIDLFGKWSKVGKPEYGKEFSAAPKRVHIDVEDAIQTAIRIGNFSITKQHEDRHGFGVLNTILGGYFGSRLMSNIREDKGYTYGIGSGVIDYHHGCSFVIMTEVGKDVAEATLAEIKKEIEVLQTELVGEEELNLVRNYMMGQLLRSADGPYAMLDMYNGTDIYGLGLEYYDQAIEKINSITAEDLRNLAKEHLNWDNFIVATAG